MSVGWLQNLAKLGTCIKLVQFNKKDKEPQLSPADSCTDHEENAGPRMQNNISIILGLYSLSMVTFNGPVWELVKLNEYLHYLLCLK